MSVNARLTPMRTTVRQSACDLHVAAPRHPDLSPYRDIETSLATGRGDARDGQKKEGEMPNEKFYEQTTSEGGAPHLSVAWGNTPTPQVTINGAVYDRSALNRLVASLRKARDQVYGADA